MTVRFLAAAALVAPSIIAAPALRAQTAPAAPPAKHQFGDPVAVSPDLTFDPIIDGRLRYEHVDVPVLRDANAVTLRLRAGFELKHSSGFSFLAEGEGTLGIDNDENALPFVTGSTQRRPEFAIVTDPQNIEINRLQLGYKTKDLTATVGRQRIALDDQRWVGNVGWRQNEQTFDAVRAEVKLGPVNLDGTYAISQRTIFGIDARNRQAYDGRFGFIGASITIRQVQVKGFAYLLDYDTKEQLGALATSLADTQTYGVRAVGTFPLTPKLKLNLAGSYARQSDYGQNPVRYHADYVAGEGGLAYGPLGGMVGYEKLGSDNGRAVQTPMATLHKFNGWADLFLVTPNAGLQDYYAGVTYKFTQQKVLPGLNAAVTYHRFDSDVGDVRYGDEWDASLGFKIRQYSILFKYADYDARRFAVNTRKFWAEVDFAF